MSIDRRSMDKHNAYSHILFYKIIDDELWTVSPDHVLRSDLNHTVDVGNGYINLDGERFKLFREIT